MSSRREPGIDVSGATLASKPTPATTAGDAGADPTLAADGTPGSERPADLVELEAGTVIARYRIVSRLGAGGMGVVYRAHDAQLDREVALKLLRVGEDGTEGRSRMLREAKAAAKIRHPNVVTVYDAGEVFGRVFIAMELIDGITLKAYFRGRKRGWREVVEVMLGAGEGLAAAHQAGLVHRDFKPDNVLVEAGGRVRVLDFGLARPASEADPTVQAATLVSSSGPPVLRTLTQTGMLVGTPAYMAPEQHLARAVDARTDQFAYCVSFYECLYGERPFAGETQAELTMNVLDGRLLPPRDRGDAPGEIFTLLQRGLAVAPADRYPALGDLLARLRALVVEQERRPARHRLISAAVLVPLLAAGGAVALYEHEVVPVHTTDPLPPLPPPPPGPPGSEPVIVRTSGAETLPPIAAPPARAGVPIGPVRVADAAAVARLIAGILPEGTTAESGAEGLHLAGPAATAWRDVATELLAVIDAELPRRPVNPLLIQAKTPQGPCGVYVLEAKEFPPPAAIESTPGVTRVSVSQALRVVLVLGDGAAQAVVDRLLREGRAPKFREWCFNNPNNQDKPECKPTRNECEKDALEWLGYKVRCDGRG